ncbi:solute carrier family 35 member F5-like isoform X2 [Ostrea edulis]|uniref:solute carrier family 35 member F5-like isoform X2 n=1 Tax=Ostrea edulis TaxID=37623 RepID=UPI0024AFCF69|nr:solute carrier family 35 member F5-like isoform X2 [Ostrea edulis]XP_056011966.1 solute carrier family 35 member F5-like isoform X2 [Ostrea edulis]
MFGLHGLSKVKRLLLGIFVLLVVDLIWVASSEVTEYIFKDAHYDKPFFTTYIKTSMFSVYLLGFIFFEPWRQQCKNKTSSMTINNGGNEAVSQEVMTEPQYVPAKFDDKTSGTESDDSTSINRSVRFSKVNEVRQLSESYAEDALIARLSYSASLRAEESRLRANSKLTVKQVAKLALLFCVLWFVGNFSYQEALKDTEAGIVNVLSSTSGLFTLVCAAIYPSSSADRFTLSKLSAVLLSIGGIVMVSLADLSFEDQIPVGALWALCGSMLYALYLVSLRRRVDHEDKLDITMFFGFVGVFCVLFLWPGFLILHYSGSELFRLPDSRQWLFIAINGLIGTVLSEVLWLWGCFLTSSLIATLALSLTIPLTMLTDVFWKGVTYHWMFYVGSVPVFIAFFAVSLLTHYETWDPVLLCFKKILHCFCRRRLLPRVREIDREQTESLIDGSS